MFGYIKPAKAELKVKEWEAYQGIYCGLCKQLARRYGWFARMTLNYDFAGYGAAGKADSFLP